MISTDQIEKVHLAGTPTAGVSGNEKRMSSKCKIRKVQFRTSDKIPERAY
jgi:hypothetical protein